MKIKSVMVRWAGRGRTLVMSRRHLASVAGLLRARKKLAIGVVTGVVVLSLGGYGLLHVSADTATLVPDGDVTNGWGGTGGTNDNSCAGGTRCDFVDEGTTDKTTDYITTTGSTAGGEVQEFTLSTVAGVSSASQVVVRIYAQTTAIGGGTADTLSVNLRVNGTLQTAGTCTPSASYAACTVTFNGSWTQADVDSMQVSVTRNKLGSGNPNNQADTINLANVYATVTYTPTLKQTQSAYRWFDNQDATGQTMFAKTWGDTRIDEGNSLVQTTDGGYAVTGSTYSYGSDSIYGDMFLAKYDSSGNLAWSRTWGGYGTGDVGYGLIQTTDGGYAVTGYTTSYGAGGNDMFLAKYDSSGNLAWSRTWGGTGNEQGKALVLATDGGYAVTGTTDSYGAGGNDMFLAKYDASGSLSWSRTWGGTGNDFANSLLQTSDGGYAVTGGTDGFGAGSNDMFLAKYDASGSLSWSRTWGGTWDEYGYGLVQTTDGGYVVTGYTASYGAGGRDAYLVKYSSAGTLLWQRTWGGSDWEEGRSLIRTTDGGFAVTGSTYSFGAGTSSAPDMFLAKYDASGNISGCTSPMCQSPTASTTAPTAAVTTTPTASTTAPTAAVTTTPTASTTAPTANSTTVIATVVPMITTGTPRATANTAMTAPDEGTIFRLRLDIHMSGSTVNAGAANLKLQYAPKGASATCSVVPTGSFVDVTDSSTISYADNPVAANGINLTTSANDPTHGTDTNIAQTYYEKGTTTFTNSAGIASGQDGMWDFALQTNQTFQNTSYCLRIVQTGGKLLDTYSAYPELITAPARFTQSAYRWFDTSGIVGGQVTFVKSGIGTSFDEGQALVQTSDGGYAITGRTASFGAGGDDVFLAKYDASGNLSWSKTWGGSGYEIGFSLVQTSDGGYVVTGRTSSFGAGDNDAFLIKYDASGNLSWSKTWGGTGSDQGYSVVQSADGGYAITGSSGSYGAGYDDVFLAKYDASGNLSWSKTWGGSGYDSGKSLIITSDGGYAISGAVEGFGAGQADVFLAKYDASGNLSWSKTWGGSGGDQSNSLLQTSDGGYAITGRTSSFGAGGNDVFLAKYDASGNLSWSKTWGGASDDEGTSLVQTTDGGYVVTGSEASYGAGKADAFLAKYDASGNLSWSKTWGGTGNEYGFDLIKTGDGGYAVAGSTVSYGVGSADVFIAKYDASGNVSGCNSPMCQSPTASTGSPSPTTTSPTASTGSPSPTTTSPIATTSSPVAAVANIVVSPVPIGTPQSLQNKPLDLANLSPAMLRIAVRVDGSGIDTNTQSFKLQYAIRASEASCQVVASGLFTDVGAATPIVFYDDSRFTSGQTIGLNVDDPSDGSRTNMPQSYVESNGFANAQSLAYAGQNMMWQFSLTVNNATMKGKNFCLRIAKSDNTVLTALNVADIAYAPQMHQLMRGGNWYDRGNGAKQWKNL